MKRRLRIAHIAPGLDVGGLEKLLVDFARYTDPKRFALRFVSLGSRGTLAGDIEACGWPVTALERPEGLHPRLVLSLAWLLRRWRIDVVHTHDDRAHIYGASAGRLAAVKRVIHTRHHGEDPAVTRRQALLIRFVTTLTDHLVCVSRDGARLAACRGIRPPRLCALWNGIDTTRFQAGRTCRDGPVITVARINPVKDIETLIRAMALAAACSPAIRLEVAGDGPSMPGVQKLIGELGLTERVRLLGEVHDVPKVLGRAGLFVLPSLTEGISLTILEAMASGLPVVATRVGGNPEVVEEGKTGLLVPPGDPQALAGAMLRLWNDPALRLQFGQAGRLRVEEHFDIRGTVAKYEKLYEGKRAELDRLPGALPCRRLP